MACFCIPTSKRRDSEACFSKDSSVNQSAVTESFKLGDIPALPPVLERNELDTVLCCRVNRSSHSSHFIVAVSKLKIWAARARKVVANRRGTTNRRGSDSALGAVIGLNRKSSCAMEGISLADVHVDPVSREDLINAGKKLLEQRLSFLKLGLVEMDDDGNCQFRAFSNELFGTQRHHAEVRRPFL